LTLAAENDNNTQSLCSLNIWAEVSSSTYVPTSDIPLARVCMMGGLKDLTFSWSVFRGQLPPG